MQEVGSGVSLYNLAKDIAAGGFATLLIAILIAGKYRVWMWCHHHDEIKTADDRRFDEMVEEKDKQIEYERKEKEEWRKLAWDTKRLTEQSVTLAAKVVNQ